MNQSKSIRLTWLMPLHMQEELAKRSKAARSTKAEFVARLRESLNAEPRINSNLKAVGSLELTVSDSEFCTPLEFLIPPGLNKKLKKSSIAAGHSENIHALYRVQKVLSNSAALDFITNQARG